MRKILAKVMNSFFFTATLGFCLVSVQGFSASPSAKMGAGLYNTKGANSCLFCHGITGEGGNVKDAADLSQPKTWKAWAALGGDAAFAKDKKAFLAALKKASVDLLITGAIRHNASYKEAGFDWSKTKKYNAQMMGLTGTASAAWLKKYKEKGVTPEIAAESIWLHLATLDKQGVLSE